MSRNYYAEINLHVTWHTKESAPLLVPKVEAVVHHYLRGRCINTPGVFIHEIGGIETHVHLAVSIAPTIVISDFIGQLKGSSSHEANQKLAHKVLDWQTGYGVVSFGTGDLEWVKQYIRNQRERHARGQIVERLERITEMERVPERPAASAPAPNEAEPARGPRQPPAAAPPSDAALTHGPPTTAAPTTAPTEAPNTDASTTNP